MNFRDLALRAVRIGFGYGCAVAIAAIVTVVVQVGNVAIVGGEPWVSPAGLWGDLATILIVGFVATFVTALPGFLGVVFFGWVTARGSWLFFAVAGALDVFPAVAFYELLSRPDYVAAGTMLFSQFPLICLPGGFLGGIVYWFVAGRRLAPAAALATTGRA